jgi:murein DD-endopeptidase MepM/ murein hydrolase activator NlpD
MSPRRNGSQTGLSPSCYFVTISRGDSLRALVVRPWQIYLAGTLAVSVTIAGLGAAGYQYLRDDVISNLLTRQSEMQFAYEDRLSALRGQIDRIASKQLLNQDTVEGRVHDLLSRQVQLETRASMITNLARLGGVLPNTQVDAVADKRADARTGVRSMNPLLARQGRTPLPPNLSAYAPTENRGFTERDAVNDKPVPELPATVRNPGPRADARLNPDVPVPLRLEAMSTSLEHMERGQMVAVASLAEATRARTSRLSSAISEAGLSVDKFSPPAQKNAVGGPFIPIREEPDASPFEKKLVALQKEVLLADRLTRVMPYLPLRRPLDGKMEVTSPFGQRVDPFMGRMALHSGLDLRDDYGAPVHVTAGGTVTNAGWSGGYGNMVEVQHGNGLSTRYGHLASISVTDGQEIKAGAVVGRLGSTGRSTGPHLHYEVRINDEPVDPVRFLRAADKLAKIEP